MFANADLDAEAGSRTNRGSAVALRKCRQWVQGAAVIGSEEPKRSDRGASAVRGHLVRAGPPRAACALVESHHRGGEEGEKHG